MRYLIPSKVNASALAAWCKCIPNDRDDIKEVRAGDIAALIGMKDVTTGDTLCDQDA